MKILILVPIVMVIAMVAILVVGTAIVLGSPRARRTLGKFFVGIAVILTAVYFLKLHGTPSVPRVVETIEPASAMAAPSSAMAEAQVPIGDAPTRPDWVAAPPSAANSATIVLHAGPETSRTELQNAIQQKLAAAATDYCSSQFGRLEAPLQISPTELKSILIAKTHLETQQRSVGSGGQEVPVYDQWALVEFTPAARRFLESHWQTLAVTPRLWIAGEIACGLFALLAVVYTYLRVTDPSRSKRPA